MTETRETAESAHPLLQVRNLSVRYRRPGEDEVSAVDGAGFDLAAGETLGLLGESGCGKTSLALAIPGLLPPSGRIAGGRIRFRGQRLDRLSEPELERLRGAEIGLVFQEPALALHPMKKVGQQVADVLRAHPALRGGSGDERWSRKRCREEAAARLAEVGLDGARIAEAYPHELSGGQRQRVVIAQALACRPALLIADEPTVSLDTTSEARVLELLRRLSRRRRTAFLYISHDPRVLAQIADRVLVMYAGRLVEEGPCDRVLSRPLHPYTEALLRCLPPAATTKAATESRRLPAIPGRPPASYGSEPGCRFAPRCGRRMERCDRQDPEELARRGRRVWCFLHPPGESSG